MWRKLGTPFRKKTWKKSRKKSRKKFSKCIEKVEGCSRSPIEEQKKEHFATKKDIETLTIQMHQENEELKKKISGLEVQLKAQGKRSNPENFQVLLNKDNLSNEQRTTFNRFNELLKNEDVALFLATRSVEESTRNQYFSSLSSFFKEEKTMTIESVLDFFSKQRIGDKYSIGTLSGIKKVLKLYCTRALGWSKEQFPRIKISSKKMAKESCYVPSKTEIEALIDKLRTSRHPEGSFLIEIMFVSALRPIDMVGLSSEHFTKKDGNFVLVTTEKKTNKKKNAYVSKRLYEEAQAANGPLFPFLTPKNYRKWMNRFFEANCAIGMHRILPKSLRKASITEIYKGATDAAKQGSHSTAAITFEHYIDPIAVSARLWRDSDQLE